MLKLDTLKPAGKRKKRIGRGGSRGGTSGKGHKGQKARSGGSPRVGFEGGQMPLFRRLPKRGFGNVPFKKEYQIVSLERLAEVFDDGSEITKELLLETGIVHDKKSKKGKGGFLVKILGGTDLTKKFTISADAFSTSAKNAIEKSGGQAKFLKEI